VAFCNKIRVENLSWNATSPFPPSSFQKVKRSSVESTRARSYKHEKRFFAYFMYCQSSHDLSPQFFSISDAYLHFHSLCPGLSVQCHARPYLVFKFIQVPRMQKSNPSLLHFGETLSELDFVTTKSPKRQPLPRTGTDTLLLITPRSM
jgi:hypothetical protein